MSTGELVTEEGGGNGVVPGEAQGAAAGAGAPTGRAGPRRRWYHRFLPQPPETTDLVLGDSERDKVVMEIVHLRVWYEQRARWHRRWFRITGVLMIVLSATLPLLAGLDFGAKNTVIAATGLSIAILAGLRNFYKWDQLWGVLRRSSFELAYLIDRWRLDVADVRITNGPEMEHEIHKLTAKLLKDANAVRERESSGYFGSLHFPSSDTH